MNSALEPLLSALRSIEELRADGSQIDISAHPPDSPGSSRFSDFAGFSRLPRLPQLLRLLPAHPGSPRLLPTLPAPSFSQLPRLPGFPRLLPTPPTPRLPRLPNSFPNAITILTVFVNNYFCLMNKGICPCRNYLLFSITRTWAGQTFLVDRTSLAVLQKSVRRILISRWLSGITVDLASFW